MLIVLCGGRVTPQMIECKIQPHHFSLGLKGNPPFIDVRC
jgi:hypothetical protein